MRNVVQYAVKEVGTDWADNRSLIFTCSSAITGTGGCVVYDVVHDVVIVVYDLLYNIVYDVVLYTMLYEI